MVYFFVPEHEMAKIDKPATRAGLSIWCPGLDSQNSGFQYLINKYAASALLVRKIELGPALGNPKVPVLSDLMAIYKPTLSFSPNKFGLLGKPYASRPELILCHKKIK